MDTEYLAGLPLAEHFVIVGLHPLDTLRSPALSSVYQSSLWAGKGKVTTRVIPGTYPPQILFTYPAARPLLSAHQLPDFCFPSGIYFTLAWMQGLSIFSCIFLLLLAPPFSLSKQLSFLSLSLTHSLL